MFIENTYPIYDFFFSLRVLKINDGIEYGLESMNWEMVAAVLGSWFLVYLIIC